MANRLIAADVMLPEKNGERPCFNTSDCIGQIWIEGTEYYGEKPLLSIATPDYQSMVEQAIDAMKSGSFEKVVLSRIIPLRISKDFNTDDIIKRLREKYASACIFHLVLEDGQEWFGATPEKLLVKRGDQWSTIALAGTRSVTQKTPWTDKEIHEEDVVKEYIISVLEANGAANITVSDRYERAAGNLIHLAHDIAFVSDQAVWFWTKLLHPTPAVCGVPRSLAQDFISHHEPHGRGLYTGLLGVVYPNLDADVYVILRCAMRKGDDLFLFVGGGITANSDWRDEYQETEFKAETLKSILFNVES
jgi:isochorismate synthase